jgi:hypothetical protein
MYIEALQYANVHFLEEQDAVKEEGKSWMVAA